MLCAAELTLWRGYNCLFEGLSFTLPAGQALVVRGPNGSGKTTLLRVVCGLTRPESGEIHWQGSSIEKDPGPFRAALAYSGHQTGLKSDLSVRQNLSFATRLAGQAEGAWSENLAALGLEDCLNLDVRLLSAGQQRRAALARLLASPARLWVMDEPLANLDAAGRGFVIGALNEHLLGGGLALLAVHEPLELAADSATLTLGGDSQ